MIEKGLGIALAVGLMGLFIWLDSKADGKKSIYKAKSDKR